jgi:glutamyl-tRNA reductase
LCPQCAAARKYEANAALRKKITEETNARWEKYKSENERPAQSAYHSIAEQVRAEMEKTPAGRRRQL